ncbi:MAG: Ig-like domain-containing protein, partial [Muribaculaceae bacterium]|nr:Ig-like domain-containing protein [Muribaculaceae bacterium]
MNRLDHQGTGIDQYVAIASDGTFKFNFSDLKENPEYIHLNFSKLNGQKGPIEYINLLPKPDPLELNGSWWHQWDGFGADAQIVPFTKSITDNLGKDLSGDFIIGNGACDGDCYADLTEYAGIEGVATPGTTVRFFFNRDAVQGAGINARVTADANGKYSYLFKELKDGDNPVSFVHLVFVKLENYADKDNPKVESMKVIDPLAGARAGLQDEINKAKLYDSFAKTETSWNTLQTAITAGEAELANKKATEQSLTDAITAITEAIAGLELEDGYEKLTAEMFKEYSTYAEPGEGKGTNGAYKLFESTDNPYGTGGSDNNRWADLSEYDKLIVTFLGNDKPRVWINRSEFNGQDGTSLADSKMLDLQEGNNKWSTKEYTAFEKKDNISIFTVDLNKIKGDYNKVARLHGIKYGWGASGIVTGMYLYTSTDDLELPLENLNNAISTAEQCDKFLKTDESWNALQTAIDEGKAALEVAKPTVEFIEAATAKITEAIAGLTLQEGYLDLTKEMFKKYASVDNPGEGESTGCDYNLNVKTGNTYGDAANVGYLTWADLTKYDKLVIKASGTPRFCLNRLADGGQQGDDMESSGMIDIDSSKESWSHTRYLESKDDVYTVDLSKIVDDYGFARLHAIKYPWGQDGIVTNMYVYKDPKAPEEYKLTFDIDDPAHVVIKVNGEEIEGLKAGANEKTVADRAKLFIAPTEEYTFTSLTANDEPAALKNDTLTKTIVKAISFVIRTEDADSLAKPKRALTALIEKGNLYDSFAKTEDSFKALTATIAAADSVLTSDKATTLSLTTAGENINNAIEGLTLEEGYSYLTPEMFKKYASVEEPGEGEETDDCTYELFNTSRVLYGDEHNNSLKWADLSGYDQLILTTVGNGDLPRFCMNNEVSTKFEINPYDGTNEATKNYQTIEDNRYIIDLKKIVDEHTFAHLHSIQVNGWGTGAFLNGMYLYKNPFVAVTEVTLDKTESEIMEGETVKLTATVLPDDATEPAVSWSSDNEKVATVDEEGTVTAIAPGTAVITATAGEVSATCTVTVKLKPVKVESIVFKKDVVTLTVGTETTLGYTINPQNATDKTVTWACSDSEIATVVNGKVTALKVGKVTVTATAGEKSDTCVVKCYPKKGDATWSGDITISDAVDITNYVVGKKTADEAWDAEEWLEFYKKGANVNEDEDGNITFADASAAVKLALEKPSTTPEQNRISAVSDEA